MPIYEVQDPETGQTIELEGDSPPTEAELTEIFSSMAPQGSSFDAVVEPLQAIGGNMAKMAGAGIFGLANLAATQDPGSASDMINGMMQGGPDFAPETQAGQKGLKTLGDLIEKGIDIVNFPISGLAGLGNILATGDINKASQMVADVQEKGLSQTLGDTTFDATGSPLAATAALMAPDVIGTIAGTQAAKNAGKAATNTVKAIPESAGMAVAKIGDAASDLTKIGKTAAKRSEIRKAIKEGTLEGVGWKIDRRGNVVKDQVARDLVRSGVDTDTLGTMNRMSQGDKIASQKMIDNYEAIVRNVKGSENHRPAEVIGNSAMNRFNAVKDYQKQAQTDITKAVTNDLHGVQVDITSALDDFADDLAKLGIEVAEDGKLDFSKSLITGNTKPIKDAWRLVGEGSHDGKRLHGIKKALSDLVYGANTQKMAKGPLDSQAEGAVKALRAKINESLRQVSPNYADANDRFSKAAEAIKPFTEGMTKRFDPEFDQIDNFVGQELRKTLSNYGKASELRSAVGQLDDFAKSIGADFDDDIMSLITFNTELEKLGTVAKNSAQGVGERAGQVVMNNSGLPGAGLLREGYNMAKDQFIFTKPKEETIKILNDMRKQLK